MKWSIYIILLFGFSQLCAQSFLTDSLQRQLVSLEAQPDKMDYLDQKARLNLHLGIALHEAGAFDQASQHLRDAHRFITETGDSLLVMKSFTYLGKNQLELGDTNQAIQYFEEALQHASVYANLEHCKVASAHLYTIHKGKNNHVEALRYLELYQSAKDTLVAGEHIRLVNTLAKEYNDSIEHYENKANLHRQKLLSAVGISGFILSGMGLLFFFLYHRQKQNRLLEKQKLQEQIAVQERMASLGMLTAGIAHEIKNPLNFISNFARINNRLVGDLISEMEQEQSQWYPRKLPLIKNRLKSLQQNSEDIESSGAEINRIVLAMMDHSRGTSDALRLTDINDLLDKNLNLAYQSYKASQPDLVVHIQRELDPELPEVEAYPHNIARVIINILSNAFYALNIKHQKYPEFEPEILLTTITHPRSIEIIIQDNGPGIPAELVQKIFTPFFTTKPTGNGNTGLGLSISYNIVVQEHNGKMEVESEPGAYTRFRIILPRQVVAAN
ncbi:MAG: tetratricopeptide repeat protein [Bacteroidetes bacterium]|nr:MAG: tetratricopeptide repeat protein [Bacteroidota bacterium]